MTREEITEAVNKTFIEILEVPAEELSPEKAIFKDLGLDSLDMVDLMTGLQRRFGISLRRMRKSGKSSRSGTFMISLSKWSRNTADRSRLNRKSRTPEPSGG